MLQERVSDRLEGERQEQVIRLYLSQANELDQWLEGMHTAVTSMAEQTPPAEVDNEDQLAACNVRAPSVAHVDYCMKLHELRLELQVFPLVIFFVFYCFSDCCWL